ncbi:hypothetical protein F5Y04DRAFT_252040 [Hypomontagnella monticulosa]|nr:hypothetical protein F5Y04DRAFT_252040 [Hypomontagnella monticulosa]
MASRVRAPSITIDTSLKQKSPDEVQPPPTPVDSVRDWPSIPRHRAESFDSIDSRLMSHHNIVNPARLRGDGRYNFLAVPGRMSSRQNSLDSDDYTRRSFVSSQEESVVGSASCENHKIIRDEDNLKSTEPNAEVEFSRSFKVRWESARKVFRFLRRWKVKASKAPPASSLKNKEFETPDSPEEVHTSYSPRRNERRRSRSNSALGAPTVMAGIIAGSLAAGWSPIERRISRPESTISVRRPPTRDSTDVPRECLDSQLDLTLQSQPAEDSTAPERLEECSAQKTDYEDTVVPSPAGTSVNLSVTESAHDNPSTESGAVEASLLTHIDVDVASDSIFSSKDIYYSIEHHEATNSALFQKARITLDRLQPDLDPIIGKLRGKYSGSAIGLATLELRMAGQLLEGTNQARLSPSVWILCRDRSACRIVQRRMTELSWLKSPNYAVVYVRAGLQLAAIEMPKVTEGLELSHGVTLWSDTVGGRFERQVYLHMEKSEDMFACGTRCCVTMTESHNRDVVYQRMCRIGGYLQVDLPSGPQVVAVTTAHGLLQPWIDYDSDKIAGVVTTIDTSGIEGEDDTSDDDSESERIRIQEADHPNGADSGVATEWKPMSLLPEISSFTFQAIPDEEGSFEVRPDSVNADFLLLSVGSLPNPNPCLGPNSDPMNKRVQTHLTDATLSSPRTPGIIAGLEPNVTTQVEILPDVIPLLINGITFPTRKIRLSKPLDQGASGAWVVQDNALCGVIIAAFQDEPFALMLTAEKLFSDIKKFCTKISSAKVATESDCISDVQSTASDITAIEGRPHAIQYAQINSTQRRNIRKRGPSTNGDRDSIRDSISQADSRYNKPIFPIPRQILGTENIRRPHFNSKHRAMFNRTRVYKFAHDSKSWIQKVLRTRRDDITIRLPPEENHPENTSQC